MPAIRTALVTWWERAMPAILNAVGNMPAAPQGTPFQGTLKPSWALDRLFPTADTPVKGYPAPWSALWNKNRGFRRSHVIYVETVALEASARLIFISIKS